MSIPNASIYLKTLAFISVLAVALPTLAAAQDKRELLGSYRDWDAFTIERANGEMVCYMVSQPKAR